MIKAAHKAWMLKNTLLLALALLVAACASNTPRIDYDKTASFTDLTRFAWVPHQDEGYQSLDQVRIRRAFETGLTARGMQLVPVEQAQVLVDIDYSIDRRYDTRTNMYGYYRWHPYWWGMEPEVYVQERDESKLTLLMINPATKSVIWAGQSVIYYYRDKPPAERDVSLSQQVDAILGHFPPP